MVAVRIEAFSIGLWVITVYTHMYICVGTRKIPLALVLQVMAWGLGFLIQGHVWEYIYIYMFGVSPKAKYFFISRKKHPLSHRRVKAVLCNRQLD